MSTNIVLFYVAFALVSIMIILNLLLLWRLWLVTSQRGVPTEMVERLGQMSAVLSSLQHAQELLRSSLGEAEARLRDSVHQTSARASEQLAQAQKSIGQLQTALANLTDAQRALHQTLQQAQVALSQQLDSNMQTARSELSAGQRALQAALTDAQRTLKGLETVVAELQTQLHRARDALEQIASHQRLEQRDLERLVDMMQRIEAVLLGAPSRGAAGEHILSNVLRHLQEAGMVEVNAPIDGGRVEFALRLPQGRLLPIDSKFPAAKLIEELSSADEQEHKRELIKRIQDEVRKRVNEIAERYLKSERTLGIAIAAVPDAVYDVCAEAHVEAFRKGVLIVPYSRAVPYLLGLIQLMQRFGLSVDTAELSRRLADAEAVLNEMERELSGRFANALTMLRNAHESLQVKASQLQRALGQLRISTSD